MTFQIYHQLGHNYKWNINSIKNDNTGNGVILSPISMGLSGIQNLQFPKEKSICDPQFFLPSEVTRKLSEFPFFPGNVVDEFKTDAFSHSDAIETARLCVQYQIDNDFEYVIIPARLYGNNPTEYIKEQTEKFLEPFLNVIAETKTEKPILLQVLLDIPLIQNQEYCDEVLNWIVTIQEIDGVYLIYKRTSIQKQVEDMNFLINYMKFIDVISNINDMIVLLGYLNLESMLFCVANPNIVTIGSYETTKIFQERTFLPKTKDTFFPTPTIRLYVPGLLQLIDHGYKDFITPHMGDNFFCNNKYTDVMFEQTYKWHINKSEPYMHFFLLFSQQLSQLNHVSPIDRYFLLNDWINTSILNFEQLTNAGVRFDNNSDGSHLYKWQTVLNQYADYKHWR